MLLLVPAILINLLSHAHPTPDSGLAFAFVRHGETVANATGRYNSRTIDTFSAKGEQEVKALTDQLDRMRFDAIVVSPSTRVLRTIAPYLRTHRLTAEVWPELYECCDAHTKKIKGVTSSQVRHGAEVRLPADLAPLFRLDPGNHRYVLAPSYDDGLRQVVLAAEHLRKAFGGSGKTILVVGHSLHGGRLIELLEGKAMVGKIRPENARIMRFREQPNGIFAPVPRVAKLPHAEGSAAIVRC